MIQSHIPPTSGATAIAAPTTTSPAPSDGTQSSPVDGFDTGKPETWSPLQRHAEFFDRNHDGRITVGETYAGLRALGIETVKAAAFAMGINAGLGVTTGARWWDPLEIQVDRISAGKHGSDTGVYDADGRFDPAKFDAIFEKHDTDKDGCLTQSEVAGMIAANRTEKAGNVASKAEFSLLMQLAGTDRERDGKIERVLTRESLERLYDGSLFYHLAGEPCPFQT